MNGHLHEHRDYGNPVKNLINFQTIAFVS